MGFLLDISIIVLHFVSTNNRVFFMSEIKTIQGEFKRTIPHVCQRCGLCCQGRGDLWYDEDLWPTDCEPDNCTAYDPKTKR